MGKRILGCKENTPNEAVGDLGWITMKARRDILRLRYWRKLKQMNDGRLPKIMYQWAREDEEKDSWCQRTRKILTELNMEDFWIGQEETKTKAEWERIVKERMYLREELLWLKRAEGKTKLETYLKIKKELTLEKYLENPDSKGRRLLIGLRSGTNELSIETERSAKN